MFTIHFSWLYIILLFHRSFKSTLSVYRFPYGNSLFHYKPLIERRHQTEKLFCQCSLKDNFEKKKKCETCESKCRRHQHVVWPVMSRERDITKRVQSLQAGRVLERRHNFSDEFYPLDDRSSYQQTRFDDGKPDTLLAVLAVISYCKRLLTDTPLGRACKPVIGERNMDELLRICIRDMRVCSLTSITLLFFLSFFNTLFCVFRVFLLYLYIYCCLSLFFIVMVMTGRKPETWSVL